MAIEENPNVGVIATGASEGASDPTGTPSRAEPTRFGSTTAIVAEGMPAAAIAGAMLALARLPAVD